MSRTVPEWRGKSDDTAIPPRVRIRVFERANGHCQECSRKISPGDKWQADHVVALINGGENAESNLRCLCDWCHKAKSRSDMAEKARTASVRAKHLGVRQPSRMQGQGFRKSPPQSTATRPITKRVNTFEETS